jgi:hypothetical protein
MEAISSPERSAVSEIHGVGNQNTIILMTLYLISICTLWAVSAEGELRKLR